MERYFKRKSVTTDTNLESSSGAAPAPIHASKVQKSNSSVPELIDLDDLPRDPAKRKRISDYHPNQRDEIRRKYLLWGPHQPRTHNFPYTMIAKKNRRFNPDWFDKYANWLEYSEKEDRAYCLFCYLFRDNNIDTQHGHDAFVITGWNYWKNTERLGIHVGDRTSFHNKALQECENLLKKDQSISASLNKQKQVEKIEQSIRLNAAIDVCRYLLHQGHSFRGHDESKESENKGNYRELMEYTCKQNSVIAKAFKFAPLNNQMLSPKIQKDNILHDTDFANLESISDLARLMVSTRKHLSYPLVYRLIKLTLTLPVATATVERCFSGMKFVKNATRNKIGDKYLSHTLICFLEKDMLNMIPNEVIVERFYKMKDRKNDKE